eukprot:Platyproteum_vivax@DN16275_c0_g1_i1.p1
MAKGSMSQASTLANQGNVGSSTMPAKSVGGQRTAVRRRPGTQSTQVATRAPRGAAAQEMMRFYTDDAPGLKLGPITVLTLSLVFMCIVVLLHIFGKIRQSV